MVKALPEEVLGFAVSVLRFYFCNAPVPIRQLQCQYTTVQCHCHSVTVSFSRSRSQSQNSTAFESAFIESCPSLQIISSRKMRDCDCDPGVVIASTSYKDILERGYALSFETLCHLMIVLCSCCICLLVAILLQDHGSIHALTSSIALCGYPLLKLEIRDSCQISTTSAIFFHYNYFRQIIWKLASVQFHFWYIFGD